MYLTEKILLGSMWIIGFVSIWFIPRHMYRQASFIFLFSQLPAWIFGLLVVEVGWIEYPVRELQKANATSFTFEYIILPLMCVFFNLYFPAGQNYRRKITYYLTFLLPFTLLEYYVEKYTLLINYIHWEWYVTFITMNIFFYLVRSVYKWFFKLAIHPK